MTLQELKNEIKNQINEAYELFSAPVAIQEKTEVELLKEQIEDLNRENENLRFLQQYTVRVGRQLSAAELNASSVVCLQNDMSLDQKAELLEAYSKAENNENA